MTQQNPFPSLSAALDRRGMIDLPPELDAFMTPVEGGYVVEIVDQHGRLRGTLYDHDR